MFFLGHAVPTFIEIGSYLTNTEQKKEAQLWQRDRTKLDTFLINVQHYTQKHAQNWIFGPPCGGTRSNICALSEIFNEMKPCSRVSLTECQFYL